MKDVTQGSQSLGAVLLKALIAFSLLGVGFYFFNSGRATYSEYQKNVQDVKQLKKQLAAIKVHAPETKSITTSYQQAVNAGNKLLALSKQLTDTDQNDQKARNKILDQIDGMFGDNTALTGALVSPVLSDEWDDGSITYGGQSSSGRINLVAKFYRKSDHKLVKFVTMQYDVNNHKFYGLNIWLTTSGRNDSMAKTANGPGKNG